MKTDKHGNKCTKQVRVTIRTIAPLKFDLAAAIKNAEKLYGSNGIYFNVVSNTCPVITNQEAITLDVIDGACKFNKFSSEQKALYEAVGGADYDGILVAFVNGIKKPDGSTLNGCGGHEPDKPMAIVTGDATVWTMSHELGHILLGPTYRPVHHSHPTNIMYKRSSTFTPKHSPIFNDDQVKQLMKSKFLSAC